MARPSIEPETSGFRVRRTIDCATRPSVAMSMMPIGPANLIRVGRVYCAWGCLDIFLSRLSFLFFFSLTGGLWVGWLVVLDLTAL